MTRFKELRRIEQAIEHRQEGELRCALGYCRMRLSVTRRKDHVKYWTTIQRRVESALSFVKGMMPEAEVARKP